jgi:hypothetical protein
VPSARHPIRAGWEVGVFPTDTPPAIAFRGGRERPKARRNVMSDQQCGVEGCANRARFRVEYTDSDDGQQHDIIACRGCANDIYEDCDTTGMDVKVRTLPQAGEEERP